MAKNNAALRAVSAPGLAESQQPSGVGGCRSCAIRAMCLRPRDASVVCLPGLKAARADCHLVRAGDPCEQYCLPRSGALKAYRNTPDGREQVMGFYLPGELAGLDGLADGRSQWNLVTLEASSLCTVTHKNLIEAAGQVPELLNSLMRRLSGDMLKAADLATGSSAEARLAGFLIDIARRIGDACLDGAVFCLPMSRQDIASYLALAPETISRLFARLRDDGLIDVDRKRLRILDHPGLSQIAQTDLAA
ncbi:MAG: Crp/Fnr family transcriptional regulator [Gammaproteobacteria bacterium]